MTQGRAIFIATVLYLLVFFWQNRGRFLRPYDYSYFGKLYSQSQYIKGGASEGGIGDDGLYAFAGYYYITGGDISRVSFESPPLAKYLIGVSILLFHNELIINIFYAYSLVFLVYWLGGELLQNKVQAAIAAFLVTTDRLVTSQYLLSMLDLPMTVLFLGGCLWLLKAMRKERKSGDLLLSALCFSLSFTTRFFPILPLLLLSAVVYLYKKKKRLWREWTVYLLLLLPLTYGLTHSVYLFHNSLVEFIKYQYWILHWRMGEPYVPGNLLTMILTGYYQSWWQHGVWLTRDDWSMSIPIVSIFGCIGLWFWRKRYPNALFALVTVIYLAYVSVLTVGVTKFLLPVYPLLVIAAVYGASMIYQGIIERVWPGHLAREDR